MWRSGIDDKSELHGSLTKEELAQDGLSHLMKHRGLAAQFHVYQSGMFRLERHLPWIDVRRTLVIADGRMPGADSALVLDLRTSPDDPAVLGSNWGLVEGQCLWHELSPSLSEFMRNIEALEKRRGSP
jgi:hypothetical protein